jgi:asparagine synthase (glutamine-hydrolysing)
MCGICGIVALKGGPAPSQEELRAMAATIRHRGPDDEGFFTDGPAGFGFRRLSIVDLSGGHQPMSNEDGTVWIEFNGEIYNHAELRPDLERRGHRYATRSDTETIVHLYEEYGADCVHHLRGMFAFAIWDARKRRLFCARDRLGIKPFYYAVRNGRFAFASEMKALFELPGFAPQMNRGALPEFFALGYLSDEQTLFDGVCKLPPGHHLTLDVDQPQTLPVAQQYWDLDITPDESLRTEADYVARFEELFTESVRLRLMSDVPLGVFLSGGLDSSAIGAVTADLKKQLGHDQLKTFSVGYAEDQFSELPYAQQVARHIGAEYNEVLLGPEDFWSLLPQLIWHEDEPIVWPSSVALHAVSRLARQKVTVVLTGEGGDEIFAGYLKYRATLWNTKFGPTYRKLTPAGLRRMVRGALESDVLPRAARRKLQHTFLYHPDFFEQMYFDNWYSIFPQAVQAQLFTPELQDSVRGASAYATSLAHFRPNGSRDSLLSRLLYLDIKTYLVELLMKQDQMSMAASIESRVPFLDHKLVEFAARIPARHKVRFLAAKYLLKRAMEKRLPREILYRRKMGFPTPVKPWLRTRLFDRIETLLTDGRLAARKLLNDTYVRGLLAAHRSGRADATDALWRLANFELWNRIFFDRDSKVAPRSDLARSLRA